MSYLPRCEVNEYLVSERSERDSYRGVQLKIGFAVYLYIYYMFGTYALETCAHKSFFPPKTRLLKLTPFLSDTTALSKS